MSVLFRREPSGPPGGQRPDDRAQADRTNASEASAIQKIIEQRLVTAEFQPIVRIDTGEIVAFESFARGPVDSPLSTPRAMFRAAAAAGLTGELDLIAANAAFAAARYSPQLDALTFFVNIDPSGLRQPRSEELQAQAVEALAKVRVVFELPEQALIDDPVGTIIAAEQLRRTGGQVAIDNVGASVQALPLLPFVRPDVIKLAPMLVTSPIQRVAPVVAKLTSYSEPSGGLLIAQGIEQDDQRHSAVGMGARLGQGYLFGRPVTVPVTPQGPAEPLQMHHLDEPPPEVPDTPHAVLRAHRRSGSVAEAMSEPLAQHLMERVEAWTEPFVMAVVTNGPGFLNGGRSPRLRTLARKASLLLVATSNPELTSTREMNVTVLGPSDPLREELGLLLLSPYGAAALAGRKNGDTYECLVTYDRVPVSAGIRTLLRRCIDAEPPQ